MKGSANSDLTDLQMLESRGTVGGRTHRTENSEAPAERDTMLHAAWIGGLPAFERSVPVNRGQRKEDKDSPGRFTTHMYTLHTLSKTTPLILYTRLHTHTQ